MKRNLYIAAGLLAGLFLVQNAYSAAFSNSPTVPLVSISSANVTGAPAALTFNPSTNVMMAGNSESTSFLINAYHTQALAKAAGQAYAMVADSNKMYFMAIEATGFAASTIQVAGTNSGDLTGYSEM